MTHKSLLLRDKDHMNCKGMLVSGDGEISVAGTHLFGFLSMGNGVVLIRIFEDSFQFSSPLKEQN